MPFVKLDCKLLHSTLWLDVDGTRIFITALLMAEPWVCDEPVAQLDVNTMKPTGWKVPAGWYGFVPAAGPGIVTAAVLDMKVGMNALVRLGMPEAESRSPEFDGRRLVRVRGGFVVLNYMHYREQDLTGAERQRRWRDRNKAKSVTRHSNGVTRHVTSHVTQAEVEAEVEVEGGLRPPRARTRAPPSGLPPGESKEIPTGGPASNAKKRVARRPRERNSPVKKGTAGANGVEAWDAYATAYRIRYGVEPVRNAKVNSCMSRLAAHLPAQDLGDTIRWYVRHNDATYVRAKHCVELLVRDAEGLHTEMARGEGMTSRRAREVDSAQTSLDAVEAVMRKHPEWDDRKPS